jgi:adhesin transport system outer membrane protein
LAQTRLLRAQTQKQSYQGELEDALSELLRLTQAHVESNHIVPELLMALPEKTQLTTLLQQNSSAIAVKRAQADVAQKNIDTVKKQENPTLYLQLEQDLLDKPSGRDSTRVGLAIDAETEGLGFAVRGKTASAQSRYQAALFDVDSTRNDVSRELDSLLINRDLQYKLMDLQEATVKSLEVTMASFLRQYESGRKSWLDVLNTQRELTEQRQQLVQTENDLKTTLLKIQVIIGGLDEMVRDVM